MKQLEKGEYSSPLSGCQICPRECGIDRHLESGFCQAKKQPTLAAALIHQGEEPFLGRVGNLFFHGCNLSCLFCQNHQISQSPPPAKGTRLELRSAISKLIEQDAETIGLVSPTHFTPQIVQALQELQPLAVKLLHNGNGYEKRESLKLFQGLIDIYLPDFKYGPEAEFELLQAPADYFSVAGAALEEMLRQTGARPRFDEQGRLLQGVVVRHLVLPNRLADTEGVISFLSRNFGSDIILSLMSQYYPTYRALKEPLLARPLHEREYLSAVQLAEESRIELLQLQELESTASCRPDFAQVEPFTFD